MNKDLIEFGNNLRAERNRKNLSQEGLAEIIDMQSHHMSKIENGHVDLKFSTIVAILRALDLKFETLFDINKK